jgi:hypothetical protein
MLKKLLICLGLLLVQNNYSQEKLVTFKNNLKGTYLSLKNMFPIVNANNNDISLFLVDSKQVNGYLLDENFKMIDSVRSDKRRRKYKNIIGYSVGNKRDYKIFLTNNNQKKFAAINFSYSNKSSKINEFVLNSLDEVFIQSLSLNNKFYLLSMKKQTSIFNIYKYSESGDYELFTVDFSSEKFIGSRNEKLALYYLMPGISYGVDKVNLKKIDENVPVSIELASEKAKMYIKNDGIMISFDNNKEITQIISISGFETNKFNHSIKRINKPYSKVKYSLKKTNSFISDNYIFMIGSVKDEMTFETRNFESGALVKDYSVAINDSISFKNSPIIQKGGAYNTYRELEKTSKFLRKINSSDVGISVENHEKGYKIILGGKKEVARGGMMTMGGFGMPIASFGAVSVFFNPVNFAYNSYSNTKSTIINCLFDDGFNHIKGDFPENEFDKIKEFEDVDRFRKRSGDDEFYGAGSNIETIFKYKGYFIKGTYFSSSHKVRFLKF